MTEESTWSFNFTQREHARTKSRLATDSIARTELKAMTSHPIPQTFEANLKETKRPGVLKEEQKLQRRGKEEDFQGSARVCRSTSPVVKEAFV